MESAFDDLLACLRAGRNVVSASFYPLLHPASAPREVLDPELPDDVDVYTELLEELRGGKVSLRVPQRGDKRNLMETV